MALTTVELIAQLTARHEGEREREKEKERAREREMEK